MGVRNNINFLTVNRLYIEEDSRLIKKLYITSIELADAGKYSCQGKIDGRDEEKTVSLEIFRE